MRYVVALVASLVISSGCAARAPGNGALVILDVDDDVANYAWPGTSGPHRLETAIGRGAAMWNVVGANVRLAADAGNEDGFHLHVVSASTTEFELAGGDAQAWYSDVDGAIHYVVPTPQGGDEAWQAIVFAHEIGHAMGLQHVKGCGVMRADPCQDVNGTGMTEAQWLATIRITAVDVAEFRRVWQ